MNVTRLQHELKQRHPFRSLEQEAALSVARTAAVFEHVANEMLRPHGLTTTQYNALRILRGAQPGGLCRNEVRDRLIASVPDASRLLDRLEERGLVRRARQGDDRRYVRARITPAGLEVLAILDQPVLELHRRQLAHLGSAKLEMLIDLLGQARAGRTANPDTVSSRESAP